MREVAINVGLQLLVGQLHVGSTQRLRAPCMLSSRSLYMAPNYCRPTRPEVGGVARSPCNARAYGALSGRLAAALQSYYRAYGDRVLLQPQ